MDGKDGAEGVVMIEKSNPAKTEAFYQRMTLPVEECLRCGLVKPSGAYRWFKSPNIIAIEHYRRAAETKPGPPSKAA